MLRIYQVLYDGPKVTENASNKSLPLDMAIYSEYSTNQEGLVLLPLVAFPSSLSLKIHASGYQYSHYIYEIAYP